MKTCVKCGVEKPLEEFHKRKDSVDGRRKDCKECNNSRRIREYNEQDPVEKSLYDMSKAMLDRVNPNSKNPRYKNYRLRGIKCLIGNSRPEVREYLREHFLKDIEDLLASGECPTVDRIDSHGHYEEGNIRVISKRENSRRVCHKK